MQPFWPTGSGGGRGFLGAFDAAWMMKRFSAGVDPIDLLKEREAILSVLSQTSPGTLQRDIAKYTIDPKTRYRNVGGLVPPGDVSHLYDSDDPNVVNTSSKCPAQSKPLCDNPTESGDTHAAINQICIPT